MFSREQGEGMDLTVCPKCQRDLLRPKTLPCLHTFCLSCLKGISGDPACFICKDAFEGDPASLPTFPLVTALVDQKSSAPKDVNEIRCICEEELATSFCGVCAEYLCGRCSTSHRRSRATSSHEQLSVEEQLRAPAPRVLHCPLHPGQDVDVFCRRCQVAVCYKCGIKHHAGHDLGEIAEGGDLASSALTEALPKLEKAAGQIGQAREQFEPLLKKIGESEERESQAIRQEFSAMRQTLDQRERKVLVLVEEIARQKREALLEQLGSLALDHSAHQIALDLAHATLRQGTQQEILASARGLLDRMQALEQRFIELKALEDEKIEFVRSGVEEAKRQLALLGDVDGGQPVAQSSFVRGDKFRPWCKPGEKVLVEAVGVTKAGQEITRAVGGFRMEVTGPCGSLVAKVPMRNMSQGGVVGEFAAEEAGIYRVRVTLHGQLIKGGELRVHAATASPAHSFLEWRAEAGSVTLTVTSCDASGNRLVGGGGSFQVTVAEEGSFFTMGGEPLDVPQTLVDNGDGTYTARFQPKGPWRAQATLGGRQIKNSPCAPFEALFSSPKKFALLYNAKQDGFSSQIHQQKCGSTNNTLTLVTLKDGRMFGGFKPAAGTDGDLAAPNPGPGAGFPFASPAGGGAFGTPPTAGFGSAGTTSGGFSFGGTSAFGASGTAPGCGFSFGGPSSSTPAGASAYSFANTPSPGAAGTSFGGTTASAFAPTNEPVGEPFLFAFAPEGLLKFKRNHSQIGVGHCFTPRGPAFGAGNDLSIDLDSPANSRSSPCYYELPSKEALAGSQGNWQIDNVQVYRVGPSSAVPRA